MISATASCRVSLEFARGTLGLLQLTGVFALEPERLPHHIGDDQTALDVSAVSPRRHRAALLPCPGTGAGAAQKGGIARGSPAGDGPWEALASVKPMSYSTTIWGYCPGSLLINLRAPICSFLCVYSV